MRGRTRGSVTPAPVLTLCLENTIGHLVKGYSSWGPCAPRCPSCYRPRQHPRDHTSVEQAQGTRVRPADVSGLCCCRSVTMPAHGSFYTLFEHDCLLTKLRLEKGKSPGGHALRAIVKQQLKTPRTDQDECAVREHAGTAILREPRCSQT